MRIFRVKLVILMLLLIPLEAGSRDGLAIWDSRCEECHGDPVIFSGKYLWDMEGQLQGRHHVENLDLFMRNHYTPDHEIEAINSMLLSYANSPLRFKVECGECHGDAKDFVEKSIWVRGSGITGMKTGIDIGEFLPTHRELLPEDVAFYQKLFARIAGKPLR